MQPNENNPPSTISKLPLLSAKARRLSKLPESPTKQSLKPTHTFTTQPDEEPKMKDRKTRFSLAGGPDSPLATPPKRKLINEIIQSERKLGAYGVPSQTSRRRNSTRISNYGITVCVRKKPADTDIIQIDGNGVIVNETKSKLDGIGKYIEQHRFRFDRAYDEVFNNQQIYDEVVKSLVDNVSEGGKSMCFAYGQTGSGKTHTMFHPRDGICYLGMEDLLHSAQDLQLKMSFYEIYRGNLFDLFGATKRKVMACQDTDKSVKVLNLTELEIQTRQQAREALTKALELRSTGTTGANKQSSRSHAVLQFILYKLDPKKKAIVSEMQIHGVLSFIDLAGSERGVDRADVENSTRLEGAEINKSLLALKECIRAMDQGNPHIPFRQSKLTQVLKESFIGEGAKTCMIATINPSQTNCEHTLNTLRYADRVKDLKRTETEDNYVESPSKLQKRENIIMFDKLTQQTGQKDLEIKSFASDILNTTPPLRMNTCQALLERITETIDELQIEISKCQDEDALETMYEELKGLLEAFKEL